MINKVTNENYKEFLQACKIEPVFGCKISTAFCTYSNENDFHRFYIDEPQTSTAIYVSGKKALISSNNLIDITELSKFLNSQNIKELSTNLHQCQQLKKVLCGEIESSYFMKYDKPNPPIFDSQGISPSNDLNTIFNILKSSHEYYQQHLNYADWAGNIKAKLQKNNTYLVVFKKDNQAIGTGSIVATNEEYGVLGQVAVIPKERGKGYGKNITSYLTDYILKQGKTPILESGYDEVANLYRKIGYKEFGRWGDLYL